MKSKFQYLRPSSIEEAVSFKSKHGNKAVFWAGGTDLMLFWRQEIIRFDFCIDLTALSDLDYIRQVRNVVKIGPMTSLSTLEDAADNTTVLELLAETARLMCTPQTRTLATIGGNICRASPSGDIAPALMVLGAEVTLIGPKGGRSLPIEAFFTGVGQTCCLEDELLVEISIPTPESPSAAAYQRVDRTVVDIALVGSAVMVRLEGAKIDDARIALCAVAPTPIRAKAAEEFIIGKQMGELAGSQLTQLEKLAADCASPITDVRSGADYRRDMSGVLTRRAVEKCIKKLEVA